MCPMTDAVLDENATACQTNLPLVSESGSHRALDRQVEVAVGHDDGRVLASQLQRQLFKHRRSGGGNFATSDSAACERNQIDVGVLAQRLAGVPPIALNDVEHAHGQSDLAADFRDHARGARGDLAGLEHDRVAHRERRGDLPRRQIDGQIPANSQGARAQRKERVVRGGLREH